MASKPHSQTVRGTLDNPKTKEAMNSDKPTPKLGDATSLKPVNDDKPLPSNDSAPLKSQGNDAGSDSGALSTEQKDLPHSKKVRGTLANEHGKRVSKTQLGDPTSLKPEHSEIGLGKDAEREGVQKGDRTKSKL